MYPELDVKVDTSIVLKTFLRLRNDFLPKQQMAMTGSVSNKTVGFAKNAFLAESLQSESRQNRHSSYFWQSIT